MKRTIALFIIGLLFFSCESDDIQNSKKLIIDSIDIDSDKKPDFVLEYFEIGTDDIPSSAGQKTGEIIPIGENLILYDENNGYLFLKNGDVVKKTTSTNQQWSKYGAGVIYRKRVEQEWDENWTVQSNAISNYYLGIKLKNGSSEKIGWIKLEFDTVNGKVYILDSEISSLDELTIGD